MKGIAEINIAKQRNGPIGTVNLVWLPQYTKFANMEKKQKKTNHADADGKPPVSVFLCHIFTMKNSCKRSRL